MSGRTRSSSSSTIALSWLIGALFRAAPAYAATPSHARAPAARAVVEVRVVGDLGRDPLLQARIASWFDRSRFDVRVRPARFLDTQRVLSPNDDAVVSVWVTLEGPRVARLYFVSRQGHGSAPTYLLRDLPIASGLDEIGAEQLAEALNLSALALLEGELASSRQEVERSLSREANTAREFDAPDERRTVVPPARAQYLTEKTHPKESTPARTNAAPSAAGLAFALGYGLQLRGEEGVQHGPAARVSLLFPGHLGIQLQARGLLPTTHTVNGVDLALYGATGHLALGYHLELGHSFVLAGFAGPGLELMHYAAQGSRSVSVSPNAAATQTTPQLVIGARAGWGGPVRVNVFGELALGLTDSSYALTLTAQSTAATPAGNRVTHTPRVLPTLGIELEL